MGDASSNLGKFYNIALRFLSYRPRSEKEVRDRLKIIRSASSEQKSNIKNLTLIIDEVIQKLKEQKFVNDEEFAKWWVETRSTFKPRGIRLIKFELKHKGINSEMVDRIIQNSKFKIQNDLDRAKQLVEKKIKRLEKLPKEEIYIKLGRYLASRGFDWDTIKKSIDEVLGKGV